MKRRMVSTIVKQHQNWGKWIVIIEILRKIDDSIRDQTYQPDSNEESSEENADSEPVLEEEKKESKKQHYMAWRKESL